MDISTIAFAQATGTTAGQGGLPSDAGAGFQAALEGLTSGAPPGHGPPVPVPEVGEEAAKLGLIAQSQQPDFFPTESNKGEGGKDSKSSDLASEAVLPADVVATVLGAQVIPPTTAHNPTPSSHEGVRTTAAPSPVTGGTKPVPVTEIPPNVIVVAKAPGGIKSPAKTARNGDVTPPPTVHGPTATARSQSSPETTARSSSLPEAPEGTSVWIEAPPDPPVQSLYESAKATPPEGPQSEIAGRIAPESAEVMGTVEEKDLASGDLAVRSRFKGKVNVAQSDANPVSDPTTTSSKVKRVEAKAAVIEALEDEASTAKVAIGAVKETAGPVRADTQIAATKDPKEVLNPHESRLAVMQVVDRMQMLSIARAKGGITIHLQPGHLGSVVLTVKAVGDSVEAQITASNDGVRQALEESRQVLSAALEGRGMRLENVTIAAQTQTSTAHRNTSHQQQEQSSRNQAAPRENGASAIPSTGIAEVAPIWRGAGNPLGVDLWI